MRMRLLFGTALVAAIAWTGSAQACHWMGGGYGGGWGGGYGSTWGMGTGYASPAYATTSPTYAPGTVIVDSSPGTSTTITNGSATITSAPATTTTTTDATTGTVIQGGVTYPSGTVIYPSGVSTSGYYTAPSTSYVVPAGYSSGYYFRAPATIAPATPATLPVTDTDTADWVLVLRTV